MIVPDMMTFDEVEDSTTEGLGFRKLLRKSPLFRATERVMAFRKRLHRKYGPQALFRRKKKKKKRPPPPKVEEPEEEEIEDEFDARPPEDIPVGPRPRPRPSAWDLPLPDVTISPIEIPTRPGVREPVITPEDKEGEEVPPPMLAPVGPAEKKFPWIWVGAGVAAVGLAVALYFLTKK